METNAPKTILVRMCERQSTWLVHEGIDLNIEEYPELEGMTEEQIKEYISNNAWDMKCPSEYSEYYESLAECLQDRDIVKDKDTGGESFIYFE